MKQLAELSYYDERCVNTYQNSRWIVFHPSVSSQNLVLLEYKEFLTKYDLLLRLFNAEELVDPSAPGDSTLSAPVETTLAHKSRRRRDLDQALVDLLLCQRSCRGLEPCRGFSVFVALVAPFTFGGGPAVSLFPPVAFGSRIL
ncbi:hypothetical protein RF11_15542 [Thelohanellus kitauei]|uniref:Uncharacterized protein n=1 Tax=Thelohanellus kitauei TaxID=669202 RepID=A0A0C2NI23_THEKT|nr:hypothetical protein RF11_15542 [Thelohanellus kitauei]